jgi:hypothetical protein
MSMEMIEFTYGVAAPSIFEFSGDEEFSLVS